MSTGINKVYCYIRRLILSYFEAWKQKKTTKIRHKNLSLSSSRGDVGGDYIANHSSPFPVFSDWLV